MSALAFAWRRLLRRPSFLILLAVCALAAALASTDTAGGAVPPAGVYVPGHSEQTDRVASHLTDNGFVVCDDPDAMVDMVRRGELDCGAILPADLPERLEKGELAGCVTFVTAPSSYAPELYRGHVAAALFREYAPYLAAEAFAGTAVTREEVLAEYEAMFAAGCAFSFELLPAQGGAPPGDARSRSLTLGAAALLLWAALLSACGELTGSSFRELLGRLGLRRAMTHMALPGALLRGVCALALVGGALAVSGAADLLPALAAYVLLVTEAGLILTALLPDGRYLHILLLLTLLLSLALCPIYTDLALFVPAVDTLRCLLPPYWLWLAAERPLLWLLAAIAALPLAALLPTARYALAGKYRAVGWRKS